MTAGTWAADPARANSPFYVASELGGNFASALQTSGTSNDRASVCDEFINPMFATVTRSADYEHYNRTGAQRGRGSGWKNGFDHAEGLVAGAVLGYRLSQQRAILMLLEPIYETDFLPCSYGFRRGRSTHDALEPGRTASVTGSRTYHAVRVAADKARSLATPGRRRGAWLQIGLVP